MHHRGARGQAVGEKRGGDHWKMSRLWKEPTEAMEGDSEAGRLPLTGLRIAVTAADLEQLEHRGIAAYSRNLLKALHNSGAEVWLISEFDPKLRLPGAGRLPAATKELLRAAKILDDLCAGHSAPEMSDYGLGETWPLRFHILMRLQQRLNRIGQRIARVLPSPWLQRTFHEDKMPAIFVHEHRDNPYLRHQRLDYLDEVTGILCARRFFGNGNALAARATSKRVKVSLSTFDVLITTCPINLESNSSTPIIQTIHDLIPIEFARHGESPVAFTRRLQASMQQSRLFMSSASLHKYHRYISNDSPKNSATSCEHVAIQPPSLQLAVAQVKRITNGRQTGPWTWQPLGERRKQPELQNKNRQDRTLRSLRFFLFNSSVEPRKNVLFLIKVFRESRLAQRGYHLCITGALKQDSYSREVRRVVGEDESIMLTGYIDESTKVELYSRALALLSPSLVEGFGIPVLDAACIGLHAVASDSESHAEIRELHDFKNHITLLRTTRTTPWASLITHLADRQEIFEDRDIEDLVQKRLKRYLKYRKEIENNFVTTIQESVQQATSYGQHSRKPLHKERKIRATTINHA